MTDYTEFKLAAIQAAPVYFDRKASTQKACELIRNAGAEGATIAAFSETWLPGYPFFVWGSPTEEMFAEYIANSVEIPSDTTEQLCEAAQKANLDVVIGIVERDNKTQGTVYCTLLFLSNEGEILGRHRKLKPTSRERTIWGEGDGSSLVVYERPYGKISGLSCWEHNMVLPGYALMALGTNIHIASWPGDEDSRHGFLSQAFASQAAAYVIDVGAILSPDIVSESYRELAYEQSADSCIINPCGEIIAGPAQGETILYADCSMEEIYKAKAFCDVAGHYSRPDIFQLHINRKPGESILFADEHNGGGEQTFLESALPKESD